MRVVHQTNRHVLPCHTLMALLGMGMPKPLEEFSRGDHPVNGALLATCLSHFFSPLQSPPLPLSHFSHPRRPWVSPRSMS